MKLVDGYETGRRSIPARVFTWPFDGFMAPAPAIELEHSFFCEPPCDETTVGPLLDVVIADDDVPPPRVAASDLDVRWDVGILEVIHGRWPFDTLKDAEGQFCTRTQQMRSKVLLFALRVDAVL